MTAAHRTYPLGSIVRVTNVKTGHSALVRITDRGPFIPGRVLDLSLAAARQVDVVQPGSCKSVGRVDAHWRGPANSAGKWAPKIGGFPRRKRRQQARRPPHAPIIPHRRKGLEAAIAADSVRKPTVHCRSPLRALLFQIARGADKNPMIDVPFSASTSASESAPHHRRLFRSKMISDCFVAVVLHLFHQIRLSSQTDFHASLRAVS